MKPPANLTIIGMIFLFYALQFMPFFTQIMISNIVCMAIHSGDKDPQSFANLSIVSLCVLLFVAYQGSAGRLVSLHHSVVLKAR